MSPLERLEWLTKLAESGCNFGMMAVASEVAYRAGDAGCFGLPKGGMSESGARKARMALVESGWLLRTKTAWHPAYGKKIQTAPTGARCRSNRIAPTGAITDPTGAANDPTGAKSDPVGSHNWEDSNGTSNGTDSPIPFGAGVDTPDPIPKPAHYAKMESLYQRPTPYEQTEAGMRAAKRQAEVRADRLKSQGKA